MTDPIHNLSSLGLVSIASAIASAVIPWCTDYGVFLALRLLTGFLCGGLDAGKMLISFCGMEGIFHQRLSYVTAEVCLSKHC